MTDPTDAQMEALDRACAEMMGRPPEPGSPPALDELEDILRREGEASTEILPSGEIAIRPFRPTRDANDLREVKRWWLESGRKLVVAIHPEVAVVTALFHSSASGHAHEYREAKAPTEELATVLAILRAEGVGVDEILDELRKAGF